jgi:hypothetical protein
MAATGARDDALWMGTAEEAANPLLAAWKSIFGADAPYNEYKRGFDREPLDAYKRRRELCAAFSFAIPTDEALDAIAALGPVVEIGAGTGYWAKLLRWRGVDVAAYDLLGEDHRHWFPEGCVADVLKGGVEKVIDHADRTLLLVWPPMSSMATEAIRAYRAAGGRRLVYVGEGSGGCTADADFFSLVGEGYCWECESDDETCEERHPAPEWRKVQTIEIPQWSGIHDHLTIYEVLS